MSFLSKRLVPPIAGQQPESPKCPQMQYWSALTVEGWISWVDSGLRVFQDVEGLKHSQMKLLLIRTKRSENRPTPSGALVGLLAVQQHQRRIYGGVSERPPDWPLWSRLRHILPCRLPAWTANTPPVHTEGRGAASDGSCIGASTLQGRGCR